MTAGAAAGRPSALRIWLLAIRPATLPAAVSGVVVGLGAARASGAPFRADMALGCLAVALLLQIAANLANDLSDFRRGVDTPARMGPVRATKRKPSSMSRKFYGPMASIVERPTSEAME